MPRLQLWSRLETRSKLERIDTVTSAARILFLAKLNDVGGQVTDRWQSLCCLRVSDITYGRENTSFVALMIDSMANVGLSSAFAAHLMLPEIARGAPRLATRQAVDSWKVKEESWNTRSV